MRLFSHKNLFVLALFASLFFTACKKDHTNPPVYTYRVEVVANYQGEPIQEDSIYQMPSGDFLKWDEIKCYLGNLYFQNQSVKEAFLYDWKAKKHHFEFELCEDLRPENLSLDLGVDSSRNHLDPSAFHPANDLNILIANDMHWGWNPGYIFLKLRAYMDTIPDQIDQFDHGFVYHIGNDENLVKIQLDSIDWKKEGNLRMMHLYFDLHRFLNGPNSINFRAENKSHSESNLAGLNSRIMQNAANAFYLNP
ncbi:MAG: hypothetical protein EP338_10335 [Bacteroidetes bacterium]|nr:MAG: hypothetical protein EP338_10335 [Bacteroidota bacterium]